MNYHRCELDNPPADIHSEFINNKRNEAKKLFALNPRFHALEEGMNYRERLNINIFPDDINLDINASQSMVIKSLLSQENSIIQSVASPSTPIQELNSLRQDMKRNQNKQKMKHIVEEKRWIEVNNNLQILKNELRSPNVKQQSLERLPTIVFNKRKCLNVLSSLQWQDSLRENRKINI